MPHYITLMKWTDKGVESIKDFPKRAAALTKRVEQFGTIKAGTLEEASKVVAKIP